MTRSTWSRWSPRRSSCVAPGSTATSDAARSTTSGPPRSTSAPTRSSTTASAARSPGDPFDFVMQTEGLDFKGALESLADRFGVTLADRGGGSGAAAARARRERLYALLTRAATFYARYLWDAREAAPARELPERAGLHRADAARVPGRVRADRLGSARARIPQGRLHRRGAARGRRSRSAGSSAPTS